MRKNKKLLLGGLSVLTLVAAGSGAVSTFAWFQATTSANVATSNGTGDLTNIVVDPEYSVTGVNIPLQVVVDRIDQGADLALEMGTYTKVNTSTHLHDNSGTAGFYHAYIDDSGIPHYYTPAEKNNSTYANFAVYSITIKAVAQTVDNVQYSADTVASLLKDKTPDLTVTRAADAYFASEDTTVKAGKTYYTNNTGTEASPSGSENPSTEGWFEKKVNRALFFSLGTSAVANAASSKTVAPTLAGAGQNTVTAENINITGIWDSGESQASTTGVVYYFGLYIDGENGSAGSSQTKDYVEDIFGDFTVSLTA